MGTKVNHRTVNLSQYPDLVVIYLGRVTRLGGLKTLAGFGPKIPVSVTALPDGKNYFQENGLQEPNEHANRDLRQLWFEVESSKIVH